jgi:alpha-tubulin suppressor-like RCC1 family protein
MKVTLSSVSQVGLIARTSWRVLQRVTLRVSILSIFAAPACNEVIAPQRTQVFTHLSVGPQHTCAVNLQGEVACWGVNALGELGVTTPASSASPIFVKLPGPAKQVGSGFNYTCALLLAGDVYCWGWGVLGELGSGAPTVGGPLLVAGAHRFSSISSGWDHTCGIAEGGTLYCWGENSRGQLGDGTYANQFSPVRVQSQLRFVNVSAGAAHTCAVAESGVGYCWGSNELGQLGTNQVLPVSNVPVQVSTALTFTRISAGFTHSCAVASSQVGYCWGSNTRGEIGNSGIDREGLPGARTPERVYGPQGYVDVQAGYRRTCAFAVGSNLAACWGAGTDGELGTGFFQDFATPQPIGGTLGQAGPDVQQYAQVSPGGITVSCGLTLSNAVFCWGRGPKGQLGDPSIYVSPLPIRVPGP